MQRKSRKYVIGYNDDRQPVYGKGDSEWIRPMLKKEIKWGLSLFRRPSAVVYELVPVKGGKSAKE